MQEIIDDLYMLQLMYTFSECMHLLIYYYNQILICAC